MSGGVSSSNSPFRGSNLVVLVLLSLVIVSLVIAGVDWVGARSVGTVSATVERIGDTSSARVRRPYVVVELDKGGRAGASNPSRLPATSGARVELEDWEGPLLGSHRYVVRAVLPAAPAGYQPGKDGSPRGSAPPSRRELAVVGTLLLLLSLGSAAHLWMTREAPILRKLGWTVIVLMPLFGPGFYFTLFERLRGQPAHLRAKMNEYVRTGVPPGDGTN